jgi:hypothetical protein
MRWAGLTPRQYRYWSQGYDAAAAQAEQARRDRDRAELKLGDIRAQADQWASSDSAMHIHAAARLHEILDGAK